LFKGEKMNLEDLEEALEELFPSGFHTTKDSRGQIIIMTGLCEEDDGELVELLSAEDEEDDDFDSDFSSMDDEDFVDESDDDH
jgi:hypothetical protein